MVKIQINLGNKVFYTIIAFLAFAIISGFVIAQQFHPGNEVLITTPQGDLMDLQTAIDSGVFSSAISLSGDGLSGRSIKNITFTSGYYGGATCVLLTDNTVRCSGRNDYGQLGIGDSSNRNKFTEVSGLSNVKDIQGSRLNFCALLEDKTVKCWGYNGYGQLGDGTTLNKQTPVNVLSGGGVLSDVKKIALRHSIYAYEYTCAIKEDGTVWCWGYNGYGQLGDGSNIQKTKAVQVTGINAIDIKLGGHSSGGFTCALLIDKTVKCWGYNGYGQLGDGTTTSRNTPVLVSGLTDVKSIEVAPDDYGFACAIKEDGTVWCWGYNGYGQLGVGDTALRNIPAQVQNIGTAVKLKLTGAGSGGSVCALLSGGGVKCWGYNGYGQLGVGDTAVRKSPTEVDLGGKQAKDITGISYGGVGINCAFLTDKTVKCWGYNGYGQLGVGTTVNSYSPVDALGITNAEEIKAGGQNSGQYVCARTSSSTLKCWGYNGYGGLGTGNQLNSRVPLEAS